MDRFTQNLLRRCHSQTVLQLLILNNKYCDEYAVVAFAVPIDVLEFSAVSQIITHAEKRNLQ